MRSIPSARSVIVLLSGGLDSATTLALARASGATTHTLSFRYGQRHSHELRAAASQSASLGAASHLLATLDSSLFRSALTDASAPVPHGRSVASMSSGGIPSTYVPARNTVFLAHALAYAESLGASEIHIGANAVDYSGYPDCRPAFFEAFQRVADVGTRKGVEGDADAPRIVAPLLHWPKTRIVSEGIALGVDFADTHSCYDPGPDGRPCSVCDACILRADAFTALGFAVDPAVARYDEEEKKRGARRD